MLTPDQRFMADCIDAMLAILPGNRGFRASMINLVVIWQVSGVAAVSFPAGPGGRPGGQEIRRR
jgi:hypothetical protein